MKKVLHLLLFLVFLVSCNSDSDSSSNDELPDIITEPQRGFFPTQFKIENADGSRSFKLSYNNDNQITEIIINEFINATSQENSRVIDFNYNENGLLFEVFEFFSSNQNTRTTTFEYDNNLHVTKIVLTTNDPFEITRDVVYNASENAYQFDILSAIGLLPVEIRLDELNNIISYELTEQSNTFSLSYNTNENGLFKDFAPQPALILWAFSVADNQLSDLYYFSKYQIDTVVNTSQELTYGPEGYDSDTNLTAYDVNTENGDVLFICEIDAFEERILTE